MSLPHVIVAIGFAALLGASPAATAAEPPAAKARTVKRVAAPRPAPARSWLGLNIGVLSGEVDLPCPAGQADGDCSEGGMFFSNGVNFTVASELALRVRAMRANEDTDRTPYEIAGMIGPKLGRKWYALVGVGRIVHPDDEYPGDVTGMAWEFLRAAPDGDGVGFEYSIHGNAFGDATFFGTSIGLRFGKLR